MLKTKTIKFIPLAVFLLITIAVRADEFEVQSFVKDSKDLAALRHPKHDINGNKCAIIKVFTDIPGVQFDCNMGFTEVIKKAGEYWLYVSPGEQRLKFIKEGFISKAFRIPITIEASTVYHLVLRSKNPAYKDGKGSLSLKSDPSGAKVSVDGYPDLKKETPCSFENYRVGMYRLIMEADRYQKLDTILRINKGENKEVSVQLKPGWADLILKSNIRDAEYYLDGQYVGQGKELQLTGRDNAPMSGKKEISARHPQYFNATTSKNLLAGQVNRSKFNLKPRIGSLIVESDPPKARVYLNGDFVGYSPLKMDSLLIGEYGVKVQKQNHVVYHQQVTITTNNTAELSTRLKDKVKLHVSSIPSGAQVYIDNQNVGETPLKEPLGVGKHNIRLIKADYETETSQVMIDENNESITIRLKPKKQKVEIDTKPIAARIRINGQKCGKTPLDTALYPGEYKISLKNSRYWNIDRMLKVSDAAQHKIYRMKPAGFGSIGYSQGLGSYGGDVALGFGRWAFGFQYASLPEYNASYAPEVTVPEDFVDKYQTFLNEPAVRTSEVTEGGGPTTGEMYQLRVGYNMYYPLPMVLYAGLGSRQFSSYQKIYKIREGFADNGYYFEENKYVGLSAKEKSILSPVVGAQLFLRFMKLGGIYVGADYWFNSEPPVQQKFVINIGLFTN